MKSLSIVACAAILAFALVEANYHHQPAYAPSSPIGHHKTGGYRAEHPSQVALAHYGGGGGCYGHNCHRAAAAPARGQYGPYHSYAVRPVIYGGHGLYAYRGYIRHPPTLASTCRDCTSYAKSRNNRQHQYPAERGYSKSGASAPAPLYHQIGGYNYALKPVKALVLAPPPRYYGAGPASYNYGAHKRPSGASYGHAQASGRHQNSHRASFGAQRYPSHYGLYQAKQYHNNNSNNNYNNLYTNTYNNNNNNYRQRRHPAAGRNNNYNSNNNNYNNREGHGYGNNAYNSAHNQHHQYNNNNNNNYNNNGYNNANSHRANNRPSSGGY